MQLSRLLIFLSLLPTLALARNNYYPLDYQKKFDEQSIENSELKQALFTILNSYHQVNDDAPDTLDCRPNSHDDAKCHRQKTLSYRDARRHLFGDIHLREDKSGYYVKDIYCEEKVTDSMDRIGPGQIPNANNINTEHSWPQSKFSGSFPRDLQKSDLHHLFPTNSRANSTRSSYNFSNVEPGEGELEDCEGSSLGFSIYGSSRRYFSPPTSYRGDIARAIFYFSVRYQMPIPSIEEMALKEWNKEDPVSEDEISRNKKIYEIQGNRNPFIDYPELADLIDDF